jgi:hypothetical protein
MKRKKEFGNGSGLRIPSAIKRVKGKRREWQFNFFFANSPSLRSTQKHED